MTRGRYSPELSQGILFLAAALCAVMTTQIVHSGRWVAPIALGAIAIAIWHGAFDNVLAREALQPKLGKRWGRLFYPAYFALAAGCLALWLVIPVWALILFLAYSALHFGTERAHDLSARVLIMGFAAGLLPIAAACHWWPHQVQAIFAEMLRGSSWWAGSIVARAGALVWPAAGLAVFGHFAERNKWLSFCLLAAQLALFRWCPPLPAFAIYFCLWHTPEHLLSTSLDRSGLFSLSTLQRHLWSGLGPWLATLGAVLGAGWFGRHTVDAYAGTIFIGLSALTVPHMVLAEVCRRCSAEPHDIAKSVEGLVHP